MCTEQTWGVSQQSSLGLMTTGATTIKILIDLMDRFIWWTHTDKFVIVVTVGSDMAARADIGGISDPTAITITSAYRFRAYLMLYECALASHICWRIYSTKYSIYSIPSSSSTNPGAGRYSVRMYSTTSTWLAITV